VTAGNDGHRPFYSGPLGSCLLSTDGARFSAEFRLWAPGAEAVTLIVAPLSSLAASFNDPVGARAVPLSPEGDAGCWSVCAELSGSPADAAYRYLIRRNGRELPLGDPYALALAPFPGAAAEARLGELHAWAALVPPGPDRTLEGWSAEPAGGWQGCESPYRTGGGAGIRVSDAGETGGTERNIVIYEAMVRDMTIHPSSGVSPALRGSYAGMVEKLDYLAELGVTHIQLLPVMKGYSADETSREFEAGGSGGNNYNWGYDPLSYFVPEGWLSTDPADPLARIRELKLLVREAHRRGLGIILDVVYNHMARTHTLEAACPGYWFRTDGNGNYTSNSGCGNDFASERPMARRLIHDSLRYFLTEFRVDGFRFDLMGLLDAETVNAADAMLRSINPDIVMLGEGWRMYNGPEGTVGMDQDQAAGDIGVAMFSDEIRDLMKGGGLNEATAGFVSGMEVDKNRLLANLMGNPQHYFRAFSPALVVNYLVCHDGLTLRDSIAYNAKLDPAAPADRRELIDRIKAANLLLGTSQGIVFLHAGQERGRSKPKPAGQWREVIGEYVHNSYNAGDGVNAIDWNLEEGYGEVLEHLKAVLAFRRREPLLHLMDHREIRTRSRILETPHAQTLAYSLEDGKRGILIFVNLGKEELTISSGPDGTELPCRCPFDWKIGSGSIEDCLIRIPPMQSGVLEYRCDS
jgi:pullulanase